MKMKGDAEDEEIVFEFGEDEDDDDDEDEEEEVAVKWIKHYGSTQKILLVGEGDFSFSLSLARAFGSAFNIVATSLDSLEMLGKKYKDGVDNVRELEERGCIVLHGVDATQMSQHFFLSTQSFDRIVYNFPHVGFLFPEDSSCQIKLNKQLVKGFLNNAKKLVRKGGQIHVSHKEGHPYNNWDLVHKAAKLGISFLRKTPFRKDDYPGYSNKRADGFFADVSFSLSPASTFFFQLESAST